MEERRIVVGDEIAPVLFVLFFAPSTAETLPYWLTDITIMMIVGAKIEWEARRCKVEMRNNEQKESMWLT